jgi:hypothetical protein
MNAHDLTTLRRLLDWCERERDNRLWEAQTGVTVNAVRLAVRAALADAIELNRHAAIR